MNPTGSGRFVPSSAGGSPFSSVRFYPFNGNTITIAGVQHAIPSPGIEGYNSDAIVDGVPHQTLAPNTTYYVYAFMDALGVMRLEFSTWGWVTDLEPPYSGTQTGVGIKIYDPSRSIVGMVRTNGVGKWIGDDKNQCTASFYNRVRMGVRCKVVDCFTHLPGGHPATGSWHEPNSNNRVSFVMWQDDIPEVSLYGTLTNDSLYGHVQVGISVDGVLGSNVATADVLSANSSLPFSCKVPSDGGMVEGYHWFGVLMKVHGGTGYLKAGYPGSAWGVSELSVSAVPS